MIRFLLSFILLFSFSTASFGNCAGDDCATESSQKVTCAQNAHANQSQSQDSSSDHNHCAFHCNHSISESLPLDAFKLPIKVADSIAANYFFAYQNPILDSIERPPLSC